MIKKRNVAGVILLSIVTLGIYPLVLYCKVGEEINEICQGDGKDNCHFLIAFLLGLVTFGIYPICWVYKAMNRTKDNAYRYGAIVKNSGSTWLLWLIIGWWICGIGVIVAMAKFVGNINAYSDVYGRVEPLPYSSNLYERNQMMLNRQNNMFQPIQQNANMANSYQNNYQAKPEESTLAINQDNGEGVSGEVIPIPADVEEAPVNNQTESAPQEAESVDEEVSSPKIEVEKEFPLTVRKINSAVGSVKGISGTYEGFDIPLNSGETIVIGRDPGVSNIVLEDEQGYVSRKHCSISYDSQTGNYTVIDYSSNGVILEEGDKIPKSQPVNLMAKTNIYIGSRSNAFKLG